MKPENTFDFARFKVPLIIMVIFWVIAVVLWRTTGSLFGIYNFGYIGTALGVGMGMYSALPKRQKPWGRRLAQFLVGGYMLVFWGLFHRENMQYGRIFLLPLVWFLCRGGHSLPGR